VAWCRRPPRDRTVQVSAQETAIAVASRRVPGDRPRRPTNESTSGEGSSTGQARPRHGEAPRCHLRAAAARARPGTARSAGASRPAGRGRTVKRRGRPRRFRQRGEAQWPRRLDAHVSGRAARGSSAGTAPGRERIPRPAAEQPVPANRTAPIGRNRKPADERQPAAAVYDREGPRSRREEQERERARRGDSAQQHGKTASDGLARRRANATGSPREERERPGQHEAPAARPHARCDQRAAAPHRRSVTR